jgi:hypothetical protein
MFVDTWLGFTIATRETLVCVRFFIEYFRIIGSFPFVVNEIVSP